VEEISEPCDTLRYLLRMGGSNDGQSTAVGRKTAFCLALKCCVRNAVRGDATWLRECRVRAAVQLKPHGNLVSCEDGRLPACPQYPQCPQLPQCPGTVGRRCGVRRHSNPTLLINGTVLSYEPETFAGWLVESSLSAWAVESSVRSDNYVQPR
jgi:hypothetical protein